LTPEEEERRKAEFIRVCSLVIPRQDRSQAHLDLVQQYGRIEEESEQDRAGIDSLPDKALIDPSKLSKKQRKKAFDGVGESGSSLLCRL